MMKTRLLLIAVLLGFSMAAAARTVYQYWFDARAESPVSGVMNGASLTLDLPVGELEPGLHFFNWQGIDETGVAGPLMRTMFYVPAPADMSAYTGFRVWLDSDLDGASFHTGSSGTIDVAEGLSGLHVLNVLPEKASGLPGPLMRTMFYVPEPVDMSAYTGFRVWLDSDFDGASFHTGSSGTIDVAEGLSGVHVLNILPEKENGVPGLLTQTMIYAGAGVEPDIDRYEYWFDTDPAAVVTVSHHSAEVLLEIDASDLAEGSHTFNFRAYNRSGEAGPVHSEPFEVALLTSVGQPEAPVSYTVYTIGGICVLKDASADRLHELVPGLYIINGVKTLLR